MNHSYRHLLVTTALAAGLAAPMVAAPRISQAEENGISSSDPGFVPQSGQINPGFDKKNPASSKPRPIPTPEEARAALMMPDSGQISIGPEAADAMPPAEPVTGDHKVSQNAKGGPTASQIGRISDDGSGNAAAAGMTTGSGSSGSATPSNAAAPQAGPIGATQQTMPAKFSKRNDILDRVPIMAFPLQLDEQQRRQIFQAVMADKTQLAANADHFAPASELPDHIALNDTHPLPAGLRGIKLLQGLNYVKGKSKVLLVEPATRVVVDQITS